MRALRRRVSRECIQSPVLLSSGGILRTCVNDWLILLFSFFEQAEISSGQISALLEATGNTEVEPFYPIIFANFLNTPDKVATLIASPGAGSGGGGGEYTLSLGFFSWLRDCSSNISCVVLLVFYQAAVEVALAQLRKKRKRKSQKKKKKLILAVVWICSAETVAAVAITKQLSINFIESVIAPYFGNVA